MDLVSLGFLVLLVILGGVIAYWGDRLGRTLGKKRLSLFRLRPRHTAELITVFFGMAIPIITILLVAILSRDVRTWLVEGPRVLQQRDAAVRERDRLSAEEKRLLSDNEKSRVELQRSRQELGKIGVDLRTARGERDSLRREAAKLTGEVRALTSRLGAIQRELIGRQRDLTVAQASLKSVRSKLDELTPRYAKLQSDYAELDERFTKLTADLKTLNEQYGSLSSSYRQVESQRQEAFDEISRLQDQAEELQTQRREAERSLELLKIQTDSLQAQIRQAQIILSQEQVTPRLGNLIYRIGEEVVRVPASAGLSRATAEATLTALLVQARSEATTRGAQSRSGIPAAAILSQTDPSGRTISSEAQIDTLLSRLTGAREDQVLIAYSRVNAFAGEAVALDVRVLANPLVYREDQVIAETRINAKSTKPEILDQIAKFLNTEVRDRVRRDRMIPVSGREQSIGEVTLPELFSLVELLKAQDRTVRLQALAQGDTRAGDSLRLEFRIR